MNIHINVKNVHFHASRPPQNGGILALMHAIKSTPATDDEPTNTASPIIPAIGELWPGTAATYVGITLSSDETKLVHLIAWPECADEFNHDDAVKAAEAVRRDFNSHPPTRYQSIPLHERIGETFNSSYGYWTLTKTKSGKSAFVQYFSTGHQDITGLYSKFRVRAVSEIPL